MSENRLKYMWPFEQKPNTKNILKNPTEWSLKSLRYPLTTDYKKSAQMIKLSCVLE